MLFRSIHELNSHAHCLSPNIGEHHLFNTSDNKIWFEDEKPSKSPSQTLSSNELRGSQDPPKFGDVLDIPRTDSTSPDDTIMINNTTPKS